MRLRRTRMATPRTYQSPAAFKEALEARIRAAARSEKRPIDRFRQLQIFQRFLAIVFQEFGDRVVLKGGIALELRIDRARTTKDVDLRAVGDLSGFLEQLQNAG